MRLIPRRALRVAVPAELARRGESSGDARVWTRALAELGRLVRLDLREGSRGRAPDAWLVSGHAALPETDPGTPLVAQVHEAPWEEPRTGELFDPRFVSLMQVRVGAACARADRILTAAESARREIAAWHGVPRARIDVAPHGVDLAAFRPGRAHPGVPAGPFVLFAAALHPRKNLAALEAALASLPDPPRLVVVGGEAGDRDIPVPPPRAAERRSGVGEDELAALMGAAAAFCLPSLGEGFGLTALEAMACGAPVVVSDRGALPEVVGDAGLVVPPEAAALAAALARVLGDPAEAARLRAAARARAEGFPWSRTAAGWHASLSRAVEDRASRA